MTNDDPQRDVPAAPEGIPPPPPTAPVTADAPAGNVPGVYPAVFEPGTAPAAGPGGPSPSRPPQSAARRGLLALAAAGAVAVGGLVVKFGLPLLFGAAASGLLGGVFGGPFEKIPDDQQQALEQRLDSAFGDRLEGKSEAQVLAEIERTLNGGLPRLSDDRLLDRLTLSAALLSAADVPTCAAIARASAAGEPARDAIATAIGALPPESIARWFDINVTAMEAELAGFPAARTTDPAEVDRIAVDLITGLDPAKAALVSDLYGGQAVTMSDDDACGGVRALYEAMNNVGGADRAVIALFDVTP